MALSKDEVLEAALAILDEQGLPDLTMRRLAERLGVRAGALYWHFPNKQSILAAVADAVLAEAAGPGAGADWRGQVAAWAAGLRAALLAHRDAADVVLSMRAMGLLGAEPEAAPTRVLTGAGLDHVTATRHARTLLHFVLGHVYQEQSRAQYAALGVAEGTAAADQEAFDAGVGLLLDGCAAGLTR